MLLPMVLILCIFIAVRDIAEHKISNFSNIALLILLLLDRNVASFVLVLVGLLITLAMAMLCGFGGGDMKLLFVLIVSQGSVVISLDYLQLFLISSGISLAMAVVARRSFTGAIPMAPAILTPFIIGYLAI
jgi:Flp pilus assembly protein protease CpaA